MSKAMELSESNFDDTINGGKLVVVDFWAEWCGPCKMIGPLVDEIAGDFEGKAIVGKVNVDENAALSSRYNIRSIPTILLFKDGVMINKHVGSISKAALSGKVDEYLLATSPN